LIWASTVFHSPEYICTPRATCTCIREQWKKELGLEEAEKTAKGGNSDTEKMNKDAEVEVEVEEGKNKQARLRNK
jgi:hypothetical protein